MSWLPEPARRTSPGAWAQVAAAAVLSPGCRQAQQAVELRHYSTWASSSHRDGHRMWEGDSPFSVIKNNLSTLPKQKMFPQHTDL